VEKSFQLIRTNPRLTSNIKLVVDSNYIFTINLDPGAIHSDVLQLQKWLNLHGYQVSQTGPGSPGKETTKFGSATQQALIKFQKDNSITPANGRFGPQTRKKVNGM
jgi:peptidoglycan hydrolase-like protein with peptidoglycan-binding domain